MRFFFKITFLIIFFSFLSNFAQAQKLKINQVKMAKNSHKIQVWLSLFDKNGKFIRKNCIEKNRSELRESQNDELKTITDWDIYDAQMVLEQEKAFEEENIEESKEIVAADIRVFIILDKSGSMGEDKKMEAAKNAIAIVSESGLPDSSIYFSAFDDDFTPLEVLNRQSFTNLVTPIRANKEGNTNLYYTISEMITEIEKYEESQKVIVLLTDARSDLQENPYKPLQNATTAYSVLKQIAELDSTVQIFTIGLGENVDAKFLERITEATANTQDKAYINTRPEQLQAIYQEISEQIAGNFVIEFTSPFPIFEGYERELALEIYITEKTSALIDFKSYTFGSPTNSINRSEDAKTGFNFITFLLELLVGVGFLFLLLLILQKLVPAFNRLYLRQKYVRKFKDVKTGNRRIIDPYLQRYIEDEQWVVSRCDNIITLTGWNEMGGCGKPNCCASTLDAPSKSNFFEQQGVNKHLNWLWFGALGGFFTWSLETVLLLLPLQFQVNLLKSIFGENIAFADSLHLFILTGVALGGGLSIGLAIAEGLGRKIAWGVVIGKTLLSMLLSWVVFLGTGFLYFQFLNDIPFVGPYLAWLIFGTLLGLMLTFGSSIAGKQGILGGFLGALIAFPVYKLLTSIGLSDYGGLIGFIFFGAILGGIMSVVIARLEDFYLECQSPREFRGKRFPISKPLKAVGATSLGKNPNTSWVLIDWDNQIQDEHLQFNLDKNEGQVTVAPKSTSFINNRVLEKKTPLKDGDMLQIGETVLRYTEKRK